MQTIIDILSRLRVIHLPSLVNLLTDCHICLVATCAANYRESTRSNKAYLIEFVGLLESLITKVESLDKQEPPFTNVASLLFLESSILTSVLPLGTRLLMQHSHSTADTSSPILAPSLTVLTADSGEGEHPLTVTVRTGDTSLPVSSPRKVRGRNTMEAVSSQQLFNTTKRAKTAHSMNTTLTQTIHPPSTNYAYAFSATDVSKRTTERLSDCKREVHRRRLATSQGLPHTATYHCDRCSGIYKMAVQENPWWAVYTHSCPHCSSLQVPRLDIELPVNALELNPTLAVLYGQDCNSEIGTDMSDLESDGDNSSDYDVVFSSSTYALPAVSGSVKTPDFLPATGPDKSKFFSEETNRSLLRLMRHARHCPGTHCVRGPEHATVCRSTKLVMLHLRDCLCYSEDNKVQCSMSWCGPCQPLLQHLMHCSQPTTCTLCVVK